MDHLEVGSEPSPFAHSLNTSRVDSLNAQLSEWTKLDVPQLDCPKELGQIRDALAELPGVLKLEGDFIDRALWVEFAPEHWSPAALAEQVDRLGFQATVAQSMPNATTHQTLTSWQRLLRAPGLLIASLLALATWWAQSMHIGPNAVLLGSLASIALTLGPAIGRAIQSARRWQADMHLLVLLATIGAMLTGEYVEGAILSVLFQWSLWIEHASQDHAQLAIHELIRRTPSLAHRLTRPNELVCEDVPIERLGVGDTIVVRPGEYLPVDGRVLAGQASIYRAHMTGEGMPADIGPGDRVFAGSLCEEGSVTLEVTARCDDSSLKQIERLLERARRHPARAERWIEQFARRYTPAIIGLSLATATVPPLWNYVSHPQVAGASDPAVAAASVPSTSEADNPLRGHARYPWLFRALVLLVIACPCALVISTPLTIVCGLYRASRWGAVIKGGVHLEQLGQLRSIVFDKTGTLTRGRPELVSVEPYGEIGEVELRQLAAALERSSEHPLARALVEASQAPPLHVTDFAPLRGFGVRGSIGARRFILARREYFTARDTEVQLVDDRLETTASDSTETTQAILAELPVDPTSREARAIGRFTFRDVLRAEAPQAIAALRNLGIRRMILLTGDRAPVAETITAALGLDGYHAHLLPSDKLNQIERLLREDGRLAMVGDGVNDSPALAIAPVGIAFGHDASDLAQTSADIVVLSTNLLRLADLVQLGRRVRSILWQNLSLALSLKLIVAVIAFAGWTSLGLAIVADTGASLLVSLNSLRLLQQGAKPKISPAGKRN